MDTDDYLLLSGIQHFAFCKRQWALIHIENQWDENSLTVSGSLMHENAHNPYFVEKRGDIITSRDMPVFSHALRARGTCDVVEFKRSKDGVALYDREGTWSATPIEYKRGKPKANDADRLQLCAQAICLEEMLLSPPIERAYLYYGETRRREAVDLDTGLRDTVFAMFREMHDYFNRRFTPRVKASRSCNSCSLKDSCLPKMPAEGRVAAYIQQALSEAETDA